MARILTRKLFLSILSPHEELIRKVRPSELQH